MDLTVQLFKKLTEANGISGFEAPVRQLVRDYFQDLGELSQDKLGSVICQKTGAAESPRIMLAGHMDEIGFLVRQISKEGFIRFVPIGGWYDQVLLGHRVIIQTEKGDVIGLIGAKPPHILPADERKKLIEKKDMYIDIGASSKEEVLEMGVCLGDPIIPQADFVEMANGKTYLSKAFDDRIGVALMIQAFQQLEAKDHPNTIFAVSTVQEEIGLRGATTSARAVDPDVAIVLEVDIAGDVPGISEDISEVKLGGGPTLSFYDVRMIPNGGLRNFAKQLADDLDISYQESYMTGGATDGGSIHLTNLGVPTMVLSVPTRHIHSHGAIMHRDDYDQTLKLLVALLKGLDADRVAEFTR